jgi:hypothetical protein
LPGRDDVMVFVKCDPDDKLFRSRKLFEVERKFARVNT